MCKKEAWDGIWRKHPKTFFWLSSLPVSQMALLGSPNIHRTKNTEWEFEESLITRIRMRPLILLSSILDIWDHMWQRTSVKARKGGRGTGRKEGRKQEGRKELENWLSMQRLSIFLIQLCPFFEMKKTINYVNIFSKPALPCP